MVEKHEPGE